MTTAQTLTVARLRGATLFKLILLGSTIGGTLITFALGFFALFGVEILYWNGRPVTGITGLVSSPFLGAFLGFLLGVFCAAFSYVGLRVYALFRNVTLEYVVAGEAGEAADL